MLQIQDKYVGVVWLVFPKVKETSPHSLEALDARSLVVSKARLNVALSSLVWFGGGVCLWQGVGIRYLRSPPAQTIL